MSKWWLMAWVAVGLVTGCGGSSGSTEAARTPEEKASDELEMPSFVLTPDTADDPEAAPTPGPLPVPDVPLDELRAAVAQNPGDAPARRQLAIGLFRSGLRQEAVAQFEEVVKLDPSPDRLMDLANAYGFSSRFDEAAQTYDRVLAARPGDPVALYNNGSIAVMKADAPRAVALFLAAVRSKPDYLVAHFQLGLALKMEQRLVEAYQAFGSVLQLEPKSGEDLKAYHGALYEMALLDVQHRELERAEQMLRALIESDPDHANAHYVYAQLLLQLGRVNEAQQQLAIHQQVRAKIKPSGTVATGR